MGKVYLVTSGCYSQYQVDRVFSTRELAEAWIRHIQTEDGQRPIPEKSPTWDCSEKIEEFELDDPAEPFPSAWVVKLGEDGQPFPRCAPGSIMYDHYAKNYPDQLTQSEEPYWTYLNRPTDPPEIDDNPYAGGRAFIGYGKTVEHARRSAEELRRQTLALEGKVVTS